MRKYQDYVRQILSEEEMDMTEKHFHARFRKTNWNMSEKPD